MSNRYRFDLESSNEAIRDEVGVEADGLDQAIKQAAAGIEEMRTSGELLQSSDRWSLVIRDEGGPS